MALSPEAQALFDQYANSGSTNAGAPAEDRYDPNRASRVSEALARRGITDRESNAALVLATKMRMAEDARARSEHAVGVGRQGTRGTITGRSLADIAKGPRPDSSTGSNTEGDAE